MSTCSNCKFSAQEQLIITNSATGAMEQKVVLVCRLNAPSLPPVAAPTAALPYSGGATTSVLTAHRATFPIVTESTFCGQFVSKV